MGNWGMDLFKDGLALDIRGMFEELIASGQRIKDVISIVLDEFGDFLEDFDEEATVILALSTLVSERGYLSKEIENELKKLENNELYWEYLKKENEELYTYRRSILENLMMNYAVTCN